ncbi:MAG: DUF3160 domain-containing protein [Clostridiales bacterium]|nr:DUF3160 domain-containing protein [Clostridiales bacterium]
MKRILASIMSVLLVLVMLASCREAKKALTAPELLDLGEKYLLEMNYAQAILQFTALIEIEPKNPRGYIGLAEAYMGMGRPDRAANALKEGLEELPGNAAIERALEKVDRGESLAENASDSTSKAPAAESLAYMVPFADYDSYKYQGTPSIPDYQVSAGLTNVANLPQFLKVSDNWNTSFGYWHSDNELSDEAIKMIEKNGFAVSDQYSYSEFFQIYEANRYDCVPNFITTDSAVHTFHLMFDNVLKDLEQTKLYGILIQLSNGMVEKSLAQYQELKGTTFENAALRNTAFFSVGSKLLDSGFAVSPEVADAVGKELAFIENHGGIEDAIVINMGNSSEIMPYKADYTQFITRSHYNQTKQLQAFFKAMMWYGQMTFRSNVEDEVKSALLQTSALTDSKLSGFWANIFEPTNFFVGDCDDITYFQYADALKGIYGEQISQAKAVADEEKFAEALAIIKRMEAPKINSVPIYESEDREEAITGYRFMGQRFTLDGYVMQNLIDRTVEERILPSSLDVPAAFGSEAALGLLAEESQKYPQYAGQMSKMRNEIQGIPESVWNSNLYWSWMYTLLPYTDATSKTGYPLFMQNEAWTLKELNSFQGSWTELKHDTILYSKSPMAEMGGGEEEIPSAPDDRGYVEPNPEVFGRLASLVKQTRTGLQKRGILTNDADEALSVLYTLSSRLTEISEKELANQVLSESDYEFIRTFGGELEHIWGITKSYDDWLKREFTNEPVEEGTTDLYEHPCGVVADVATSNEGTALEEGTGFAKTIFAVFPRDGKLVLGSGSVFSQYEFVVDSSERLTDEAWHKRLRSNDLPDLAQWKLKFTVDIGQKRY